MWKQKDHCEDTNQVKEDTQSESEEMIPCLVIPQMKRLQSLQKVGLGKATSSHLWGIPCLCIFPSSSIFDEENKRDWIENCDYSKWEGKCEDVQIQIFWWGCGDQRESPRLWHVCLYQGF